MIKELTILERCAISYMVFSGCKDRNTIYQLANNPDKFNKLSSNSKAVTVSRWFNRHEIQEFIRVETYNQEKQKLDEKNKILSSVAVEDPASLKPGQTENINFLDRDEFLQFLNSRANEITDDKLRNDILKMLSDNLRYKDGENDENNEIQRFYTPLLCKDCKLYQDQKSKL